MDEQNRGGQPPEQGGWSQVPGGQSPPQGQPGSYGAPGGTPPPVAYPPAGGYGQQPPAAPGYPPPPGYVQGGQYPPPPPPPGSYGAGPVTPPPGQPPYNQPPYGQPPLPSASGQALPPNTAAALAYLTIIPAIIFLVMDPYKRSSLVRFHAWQCLVLTGVWVVLDILEVGFFAVSFGALWPLYTMIHLAFRLLFVVLFVFWLIALIKASQGTRYHIPVVGGIAENFAGKV